MPLEYHVELFTFGIVSPLVFFDINRDPLTVASPPCLTLKVVLSPDFEVSSPSLHRLLSCLDTDGGEQNWWLLLISYASSQHDVDTTSKP